jgi:hypothetical protein
MSFNWETPSSSPIDGGKLAGIRYRLKLFPNPFWFGNLLGKPLTGLANSPHDNRKSARFEKIRDHNPNR